MAAAPEPIFPDVDSPMTVEQYRQLPERPDAIEELHWGEVVVVSFPKAGHKRIHRRLLDLLQEKAGDLGTVDLETPFRAVTEYDIRSADVAFISKARYGAIGLDDNLHGSPEMVIEVLSPSNTKSEMRAKAALCLATGAEEFWMVNPVGRTVTVLMRNGDRSVYGSGDCVPLAMFGSALDVDSIFEALN